MKLVLGVLLGLGLTTMAFASDIYSSLFAEYRPHALIDR